MVKCKPLSMFCLFSKGFQEHKRKSRSDRSDWRKPTECDAARNTVIVDETNSFNLVNDEARFVQRVGIFSRKCFKIEKSIRALVEEDLPILKEALKSCNIKLDNETLVVVCLRNENNNVVEKVESFLQKRQKIKRADGNVRYFVLAYYITLHCIVLYCIVLYCIVLYCILFYSILFYSILFDCVLFSPYDVLKRQCFINSITSCTSPYFIIFI
jgi:hypothetical protein